MSENSRVRGHCGSQGQATDAGYLHPQSECQRESWLLCFRSSFLPMQEQQVKAQVALVSATRVRDQDAALASWLWTGTVPVTVVIWEVNHGMKNVSPLSLLLTLSLSPCICISNNNFLKRHVIAYTSRVSHPKTRTLSYRNIHAVRQIYV